MRRLILFLLALVLLLSVQPSVSAQTRNGNIDVLAVKIQFPIVEMNVRVRDDRGNDVSNLGPNDFQIVEDSTFITQVDVKEHSTSAISSSLQVQLVADKPDLLKAGTPTSIQSLTLTSIGATIGIVFDASSLLNDAKHKYTDDGRLAIEQFLLAPTPQNQSAPRTMSPSNSEAFSLYIPNSRNELIQPAEFATFTQDRNKIINYLRQMHLRTGETYLYDAVRMAVQETADVAEKRGSAAVVLVISDGRDTSPSSDEVIQEIKSQAQSRQVSIIAFGFGKALDAPGHGERLSQLANGSIGVYKRSPQEADIVDAFNKVVTAKPASIYTLRYNSLLFDDGKQHTLVVQVKRSEGYVESAPVPFRISGGNSNLPTLNQVLIRRYVFIAIPLALIVSFVLMLVAGGIYRLMSGSLGESSTRH